MTALLRSARILRRDLRRLAVTQTPVKKKKSANANVKNSLSSINNNKPNICPGEGQAQTLLGF